MPAPTALFHAFLRPSVLQILRATGYHGTSPAVLDAFTDLAARYLSLLCEKTANRAAHHCGDAGDFGLVEVRLALQEVGALLPERPEAEQDWRGEEDTRGVEEFISWFEGQKMKEIMEFAKGDGEVDETDYLKALKKRHNKTSDDSKFTGTILGKPADSGEIEIEGGGEIKSIEDWICARTGRKKESVSRSSEDGDEDDDEDDAPKVNGHHRKGAHSPAPSSKLSSVGDRLEGEGLDEMDLT